MKDQFPSLLPNLTLASPSLNYHRKPDKDAAEWSPNLNQCWHVDCTVQTRLEHGPTIDHAEAEGIDTVLDGYTSTDMVALAPTTTETSNATATPTPAADVLTMYDNNNGRISCAEARADHNRRRSRRRSLLQAINSPISIARDKE